MSWSLISCWKYKESVILYNAGPKQRKFKTGKVSFNTENNRGCLFVAHSLVLSDYYCGSFIGNVQLGLLRKRFWNSNWQVNFHNYLKISIIPNISKMSSYPQNIIVLFGFFKMSLLSQMVLTLRHELGKTGMNQVGKNTSALWGDDRKSSQSQGVFCSIPDICREVSWNN